jgi:hypothetical protein
VSQVKNPFVNRIIGYGTKPADQFLPNELNYRTHPQRQRDAVQASLRELGWIGVAVENRTTGRLIDGHERVWQALANNEDVPFIEVELTEEEERLALAIYDPITQMAKTDTVILDALLDEVSTDEPALQDLLSQLAGNAGIGPSDDPAALWTGMPAFEQENTFGAVKTLKVHFASEADIADFAALVGQTVNMVTTFIWYPKQKNADLTAYVAHES